MNEIIDNKTIKARIDKMLGDDYKFSLKVTAFIKLMTGVYNRSSSYTDSRRALEMIKMAQLYHIGEERRN